MKLQFSCQSVVCTLEPFAERRKCAKSGHSCGTKKRVLTISFATKAAIHLNLQA
jgi:hypothetical protein